MTADRVGVDNFVRAESNRVFGSVLDDNGGEVNGWMHSREPTPLDHQPIIRLNRDTLYSGCVADVSAGATLTIPDAGDRYLSVMVVNQDHFIPTILHEPGEHELTPELCETDYVLLGARILVDPADPADVAAVNELQDRLALGAGAERPFSPPAVDPASHKETLDALVALAKGLDGYDGAFGRRGEVDPVRHLIGTASGWGGLPTTEARYLNVSPDLPVGEYSLTVGEVPVDGFWSISVYNAAGYFEPNADGANSVNSITAEPDEDGTITVHFGGCADDRPNCLAIMEGWNYMVRLYQPREAALDGSWAFPTIE